MGFDPKNWFELNELQREFHATLAGTFHFSGHSWSFRNELRGEDALKRILAMLLIARMPSAGTTEALETLSDIFVFHTENLNYQLQLPGMGEPVVGKVGPAADRRELIIAE